MRLKYEILWFEDEPEVVEEDIGNEVKNFLIRLGFEPIITHKKNGQGLNELIKNKNYDLIISDLNLGEYEAGDILIDNIREQSIFTEVLLYSATPTDIIEIIERHGRMIERISFAVGLAELRNKIKNIINITVKKVQDVNNMRGLVIAETIDLELIIEGIMKRYFNIIPETNIDTYKEELLSEIYKGKLDYCTSELEYLKKIDEKNISCLIDEDVVTIYDLYQALQSILKKHIKAINVTINNKISPEEKSRLEGIKSELVLLKGELTNFDSEVIRLRNTLAHVQEKLNGDGTPCLESINKGGTRIIFDENKYSEIRVNLQKHSTNLNKIKEYFYRTDTTIGYVAAGDEGK
jgi:ribosomal protein S3